MIFFQKFQIHTWLVIKAFHKCLGYNLHQVAVSLIILGQQNQVVITVIATSHFTVKAGTRSHINLTSQDGIDPGFSGSPVKVDHTVHNTMIGDRRTVHTQFFYSGYILFDLIGAIQKTVFCMDM